MKGLALKFWAGMIALIAGMLLLLWLFQVAFLQNFYIDSIMSQIRTKADMLVISLEHNEADRFMSEASSLAYTKNLAVQFYRDSNFCIFNTESDNPSPSSLAANDTFSDVLNNALNGSETSKTTLHPKHHTDVAIVGIPVAAYDGSYGALMISVSLAPVETTIQILQGQLVVITVILLILAAVLSFLISRSLAKPILRIEKATRRIAEGDYSVKVEVSSNDEIGSLSESVNYMATELSKINELRKDLIANVSHDLRTPLSLIRGYAETMRDVTGDNKDKRERQLGVIIDETERLNLIVSDMLNLSLLQSGSISVAQLPFDIHEMMTSILSRYDDLAAKSEITLTLDCPNDALALGDKRRLEQVFYNLINNAFNHTGAGGKITISAVVADSEIKFSVTDTGSGISKEDLPLIFDRYYKAEAKERKIVGTGLGLAIVKNILEAHNAVYGVNSTLGVGTSFWFVLKKAEPPHD